MIKSNNTSSLSNDDIAIKVMDEFIRGGYNYYNDVSKIGAGLHCNDVNQDSSKQDSNRPAINPNFDPDVDLGEFGNT